MPSRSSSSGRCSSPARERSSPTGSGSRNARTALACTVTEPRGPIAAGLPRPPPPEPPADPPRPRPQRRRVRAEATGSAAEPRPATRPRHARRRAPRRTQPPWIPRSPPASKNASPSRSDSHAAPIRSSRSSDRRHSDRTPSGSGGTSRNSGQRASASPVRIPGTTPNASAAGDTSPTTCLRPASGARATGSPISSRRPSSAATSANRENRTQMTMYEHMFAYGSAVLGAS